jgi:hypothetical protein
MVGDPTYADAILVRLRYEKDVRDVPTSLNRLPSARWAGGGPSSPLAGKPGCDSASPFGNGRGPAQLQMSRSS